MSIPIPLPNRGINKGTAVADTPGEYSANMDNVRARDTLEKRVRIGQRPAVVKWSTDLVGGSTQPVVAMCSVSAVE